MNRQNSQPSECQSCKPCLRWSYPELQTWPSKWLIESQTQKFKELAALQLIRTQGKAARRGCLFVAAKQVWKSLAQVLQSLLPKSAKCKRTREKQVTQVTCANDLCPEWLWESLKTWTLSRRPLQPTSPASACWKQKMFTEECRKCWAKA